jgi:hypothetical protein
VDRQVGHETKDDDTRGSKRRSSKVTKLRRDSTLTPFQEKKTIDFFDFLFFDFSFFPSSLRLSLFIKQQLRYNFTLPLCFPSLLNKVQSDKKRGYRNSDYKKRKNVVKSRFNSFYFPFLKKNFYQKNQKHDAQIVGVLSVDIGSTLLSLH